jgi:hypothetical protein
MAGAARIAVVICAAIAALDGGAYRLVFRVAHRLR